MMSIKYESGMTVRGETLTFRSKVLTQYNPFGKVPVFLHGSVIFFETTPICRYLEKIFVKQSLKPLTANEAALIRDYVLEFTFPKGDNGKIREDFIANNFDIARQNLAIVSK